MAQLVWREEPGAAGGRGTDGAFPYVGVGVGVSGGWLMMCEGDPQSDWAGLKMSVLEERF